MRPTALFGLLALSAGAGTLVVAQVVLLPGLEASPLVDANLAKTLSGPIHMRSSDVLLGSALLLAALVPRWLRSSVTTAMTLLLVAIAAVHRTIVLPALYEAWSRVDLVAGRPVARLTEAERLDTHETWLSVVAAALLVSLLVAASKARRSVPAAKNAPMPTTGDQDGRPEHGDPTNHRDAA